MDNKTKKAIEGCIDAMDKLDDRINNIWNFLIFKFPELEKQYKHIKELGKKNGQFKL